MLSQQIQDQKAHTHQHHEIDGVVGSRRRAAGFRSGDGPAVDVFDITPA